MLINFSTFAMMKKCFVVVLMMLACSPESNDPKPVAPEEFEQYGTPFEGVADPKEVVLYEVNIRAFSNAGNFQGVIDRLDNIKALGVNTIWLMPIHPVGQIKAVPPLGSPYSVKDYMGVNAEFGDLTKLRELVDKAHAKNMAVIIDWVANHTSWDNAWITEHKSWYKQDGSGNIVPPRPEWQDVAQLNFNAPDMRKEMIRAMKYWVLEANIDGFRCDYADNPPTTFWKQAIDELKTIEGRKLILLAEGSKADHFGAGFQMNYAWNFYDQMVRVYSLSTPQPATSIITTHQAEYNAIPANAVKLRYTTNHDMSAHEATPIQLYGGVKGALSASAITIFLSQAPLLYSSQEVGRQQNLSFFAKDPIDWTLNATMEQEYQKFLSIYNGTDTFTKGALQSYSTNNVAAFTRTFESEQYLIIVNVRNTQQNFTLPAALQNTNWTNAMSTASVNLTTTLSLAAYDYLILKK